MRDARVEREIELGEQADAGRQALADQQRLGFSLQQPAHADHERVRGQSLELRTRRRTLVQTGVGDEPEDRMVARELADPGHFGPRLVGAAVGLHEHVARDVVSTRLDRGRRERSPQRRDRLEPFVVQPGRVPEVDVGVDQVIG